MMIKQTVFVVMQEGNPSPLGARLTLAAAISLCKMGPNRYWKKLVATKEVGASQFDNPAKQQEKQHGRQDDKFAQGSHLRIFEGPR
jgi:hypothetical protein